VPEKVYIRRDQPDLAPTFARAVEGDVVSVWATNVGDAATFPLATGEAVCRKYAETGGRKKYSLIDPDSKAALDVGPAPPAAAPVLGPVEAELVKEYGIAAVEAAILVTDHAAVLAAALVSHLTKNPAESEGAPATASAPA
jgi:hypothetical protein